MSAAAPDEEGVPMAVEQVELALDDAEPPEQPKKRHKLVAAGGLLRTARRRARPWCHQFQD